MMDTNDAAPALLVAAAEASSKTISAGNDNPTRRQRVKDIRRAGSARPQRRPGAGAAERWCAMSANIIKVTPENWPKLRDILESQEEYWAQHEENIFYEWSEARMDTDPTLEGVSWTDWEAAGKPGAPIDDLDLPWDYVDPADLAYDADQRAFNDAWIARWEAIGSFEYYYADWEAEGKPGPDAIRVNFPRRVVPAIALLPSNAPLDLARYILATLYPNGTIHFWRGQWYAYDAGVYRVLDEDSLNASLYILEGTYFEETKKNGDVVRRNIVPDINLNRKVVDAMKALPGVMLEPDVDPHCWIRHGACGHPAADLLVMKSNTLHLPSRTTQPHTPEFFSLTKMDFDFDRDADAEDLVKFLISSLPGDRGIKSALLLAEFFGYVLTPQCTRQKMLWLLGQRRSGKGTILRIIARLVGERNCTHPQLSEFGEKFALQPWEDKRLAIFADAEDARLDVGKVRERLKKITGFDPVQIERKGIAQVDARLHVKIVLAANEPPRLSDAAGALASRILSIDFPVSFAGCEDHGLEERLVQNLPGILNWALDGLDRLNTQGDFTKNISEGKADFELMTNPLGAFVEDCCDVGKGEVQTHVLFAAWKTWCAEKGIDHPYDEARMGAKLRAVVPGLGKRRLNPDGCGRRPNAYTGITMKMS